MGDVGGCEVPVEMTSSSGPEPHGNAGTPYVGLLPYHEGDRDRFFGRDAEVSALLIRCQEQGQFPILVAGPCGSGKSSLVAAGLIPELRENAADQGVELRVHVFMPTRFPLAALASALGSRQAQTDAEAFALSTEQAVHLARVETGPTLLVVDQFEEIFSLCPRVDRQLAFAAALTDLAADAQAETTVVLVMRSDAEERLSALPRLYDAVRSRVMRLPPMTPVNLAHAIERPANGAGIGFEEGVVSRLVEEVEGEFAALPLLQFTLLALWARRSDGIIPMSAMEEIGGARRALEKAAEAVYQGLITEEANCARRIFGRLVRSDGGGNHDAFTRQRALRSELRSLEDPSRVDRVMKYFVAARLLSQRPMERDALVEITHESLMRTWPRLAGWLEDSRHLLRQHAHLRDAMARWRDGNSDDVDLLSPGRIATFSELTDLDAEEKRFLKHSAQHWQRVEQNKTRRRQILLGAALVVFAVGVAGWGMAWQSKRGVTDLAAKAERQTDLVDKERDLSAAASQRETTQRQLVAKQRALAAMARKEADQGVAKAVALQQKLEIARDQLRKELTLSDGHALDAVEDLVGLAERALPDFSTLSVPVDGQTAEGDAFDRGRLDLANVTKLARRVRRRVALLDNAVNSKERQRDKASVKAMGLAQLRVGEMKARLRWFDRQLEVRRQQLEFAQRRRHERATSSPAARARLASWRVLHVSLRTERASLRRLAAKRSAETDAEVWKRNKKAIAAQKGAQNKAIVANSVGLAWYGAKRYGQAQKSFAAAARAAKSAQLRDRYATNRAWALFRTAMASKAASRAKLLRRADALLRGVERRAPRASQLRARLHRLAILKN